MEHLEQSVNKLSQGKPLEAAAYQYKSLKGKPDDIRLLTLIPAGKNLCCKIHHVTLDSKVPSQDRPKYIALSYEWGAFEKSETMFVAHETGNTMESIPITPTLAQALRHILESNLQPKTVFADQVCINQVHTSEFNHQVTLMSRIYRLASQVVTYLGPEEEHDEYGFELMLSIHANFKPLWSEITQKYWTGHGDINEVRYHVKHLKYKLPRNHLGWESLRKIMWGGWTRRLWMAPENMLNKNSCFLRGSVVLEWMGLAGLHVLPWFDLVEPRSLLKFGTKKYSSLVRRMWEYQNRGSRVFMTLMGNIKDTADAVCSDPRDKIYAILSVSDDAGKLGILPNYEKSHTAHDVYMEFVKAYCWQYSSLLFLEMSERYRSMQEDYESWLFDLTAERKSIGSRYFKRMSPLAWKTSMLPRFIFIAELGLTELKVPGLLIDTIASTPFEAFRSFRGVLENPIKYANRTINNLRVLEQLRNLGFDDETIARSILSSGADVQRSEREEVMSGKALRSFIKYAKSRGETVAMGVPAGNELKCTVDEIWLATSFSKAAIAANRKAAISQGNRICLVNNRTREGDMLVYMSCGECVYVIRPREDGRWTFVGSAYVDGYSRGEWFRPPYAIHDISMV
jgi:hypothetical protein